MALNSVGRHAEAISASGVSSALRNMRACPFETRVAVTNSLIGASRSTAKSITSARMSRSGLTLPGFMSYGETRRAITSNAR